MTAAIIRFPAPPASEIGVNEAWDAWKAARARAVAAPCYRTWKEACAAYERFERLYSGSEFGDAGE